MDAVNHNCSEHLDEKCRCTICGKTRHFFIDDDDGTFAASGKVAHAICIRCGVTREAQEAQDRLDEKKRAIKDLVEQLESGKI